MEVGIGGCKVNRDAGGISELKGILIRKLKARYAKFYIAMYIDEAQNNDTQNRVARWSEPERAK